MSCRETRRAMVCISVKGVLYMKIVWNIIGILLILVGGVWFLQGVNLFAGSAMSGHPQWAIIGGIGVLVGAGLLLYVNRRVRPGPGS